MALPLELLKFSQKENGIRGHKKEYAEKEDAQKLMSIGEKLNSDCEVPAKLRGNTEAKKKWDKVIKLYTDANVTFVSTADLETLERYCLAYAEYYELVDLRKNLLKGKKSPEERMLVLKTSSIDAKIDAKNKLLTQLSSRLYLDPASRLKQYASKMKNLEQQEEKTKNMFGD